MFSVYHILWLVLCALLAVALLVVLCRRRVPLGKVLTIACVGAVLSELVKVLSMTMLVPSADASQLYPYLKPQELPLHLCSLQILLIFYTRFAKEGRWRTAVLAFMYPTCFLGGMAALVLPSIFSANMVTPDEAFVDPLAYQFFLYHTMLVVLGLYIFLSRQVTLHPRHYLSTMGILGALGVASLYFNSIFASATYADGALLHVDYTPNFMFTYKPPLAIQITTIGEWYAYLAVLVFLASAFVALCYVPVWRQARKEKNGSL